MIYRGIIGLHIFGYLTGGQTIAVVRRRKLREPVRLILNRSNAPESEPTSKSRQLSPHRTPQMDQPRNPQAETHLKSITGPALKVAREPDSSSAIESVSKNKNTL